MWRTHEEYASSNRRLRVSLMSHVEEPESYFLDLRRTFEKDGQVLPTKRGIRILISSERLGKLVEVIQSVGPGRRGACETADLRVLYFDDALQIRRTSTSEKGRFPVRLMFTPAEKTFLLDKLASLKDTMNGFEEEKEEEEEEEEDDGVELVVVDGLRQFE